jgi:hypothetical protein
VDASIKLKFDKLKTRKNRFRLEIQTEDLRKMKKFKEKEFVVLCDRLERRETRDRQATLETFKEKKKKN